MALIAAREKLGQIAKGIWFAIDAILKKPVNIVRLEEIEAKIHHDAQSAVEERREVLREHPELLEGEYHKKVTSYDIEDPAFVKMLADSVCEVVKAARDLRRAIASKAVAYRFTPALAKTHGQWAQIQSFGYECLTWHQDLATPMTDIEYSAGRLQFSKMSGAIGNNAEIDPELEIAALNELGLKPWHGATQIMPRVVYASLASGLAHLVSQCAKVAGDIRLGARSGFKIIEEPHGKDQKGSSAMPQKRNPVGCEQITGLARAARHFAGMLGENIETWESRSIEQSCVERIAWPDLFHISMRALTSLTKIINGLNVYPDVMMKEIIASAGTYASNETKTFLADELDIAPDDAYSLIKLAAYNVFAPDTYERSLRENPPGSLIEADNAHGDFEQYRLCATIPTSIEFIIARGLLNSSPELDIDNVTVNVWNSKLRESFKDDAVKVAWHELFKPSRAMRNEAHSFKQVFGI